MTSPAAGADLDQCLRVGARFQHRIFASTTPYRHREVAAGSFDQPGSQKLFNEGVTGLAARCQPCLTTFPS